MTTNEIVSTLLEAIPTDESINAVEVISNLAVSLLATTAVDGDGNPMLDANGNPIVTDFDIKTLSDIIEALTDVKKKYGVAANSAQKKRNEAERKAKAADNKEWAEKNLSVGDMIVYYYATSKSWVLGTLTEMKEKTMNVHVSDAFAMGGKLDRRVLFNSLYCGSLEDFLAENPMQKKYLAAQYSELTGGDIAEVA